MKKIFCKRNPMHKSTYLTFLFFVLASATFGQVAKKKNYFPLWTYHQKNINIHGISVGIGSIRGEPRYTNTNGMKLEIIGAGLVVPLMPESPVADDDSSFEFLSKEPVSEKINGITLSAGGTVCDCITNGISLGMVGQINYQVNGISGSFFGVFSQVSNGIHAAGMFNQTYYLNGVQVALMNAAGKSKGIQLGGGNIAHQTSGLQIGIYNKTEKLRGIQIGIWNKNEKRSWPLVNWNFK